MKKLFDIKSAASCKNSNPLLFVFGLLLIYPFNVISISIIIYLAVLPISFFHYQKLKKQNEDKNINEEDEDLEDVL